MRRSLLRIFLPVVVVMLGFIMGVSTTQVALAANQTFSNTGAIAIPASGTGSVLNPAPANPYPSTINVSGMAGIIADVNVTLTGFGHTRSDDVDVLLVGPAGQKVRLMSDAGGPVNVSGITLTFDQSAGGVLTNVLPLSSGTYRPTEYGALADSFSSTPAGAISDTLNVFNGTDPNGDWRLFIVDDFPANVGSISGGWSLQIVTNEPPTITSPDSATVAANSAFSHTFTATGDPAPTLSYTNENLPPGVTRTGDVLSGTPTAPGIYTIDATATNGIAPDAFQTFTLTVTGDAPAITSPDTAVGMVGTPFDHIFTATGNPAPTFSYVNENLPPGVTRSGDALTGTPTAPGIYTIDATASNGISPDAFQTFTITVTGDAPVITSPDLAAGVVGTPFTHTFTAVGNPAPTLSYSNENLPPGVIRTGDTLSGTPTIEGTYTIDVTASNGVAPDAFQTLTITVTDTFVPPPPAPPPPPVPTCNEVGNESSAVVRAQAADGTISDGAVFCRVLVENGSFKGDPGQVGNLTLIQWGITQAVEVFGLTAGGHPVVPFNHPVYVCLRGTGTLYYADASNAPRTYGEIASSVQDGFTCASIPNAGTLVLVSHGNNSE